MDIANLTSKPHSYVTCLRWGIVYPFLNFFKFLKFLWPSILIFCITATCAFLYSFQLSFKPLTTTYNTILQYILWVLSIIAAILFLGCLFFQQFHLLDKGTLPGKQSWMYWRHVFAVSWRALIVILLMGLPVSLSFIGFNYGFLAEKHLSAFIFPIIILLWFLIMCLLLTPCLQYLYTGHMLSPSFFLKLGSRYWGRTLALTLMAGIMAVTVLMVGTLPSFVFYGIRQEAIMALQIGDIPILPNYFGMLIIFAHSFLSLSTCFACLVFLYPHFFNWCSISVIEQERKLTVL